MLRHPARLGVMMIAGLALAQAFSLHARADAVEDAVGSAIENFRAVVPGKIYRGAIPDDAGFDALSRACIRTDIDLQGGDRILGISVETGESAADIAQESLRAGVRGIVFVSEPMSSINPDTDDQERTIDEVLSIVADPSQQPVFFHCRHGQDRTGLIAALYRVLYQGCTPDQAHDEWMQDGHSRLLPWMDHYFNDRVSRDSRTNQVEPGPDCPLPRG